MHNKIILIGNLGDDPEAKYPKSGGDRFATFRLATNYRYTSKNHTVEETAWWNVSCFSGLADTVLKYLAKGRLVYVEGRIRPSENGGPRVYQTKDGEWRGSYDITAERVKFLDKSGTVRDVDEEQDEIPW